MMFFNFTMLFRFWGNIFNTSGGYFGGVPGGYNA